MGRGIRTWPGGGAQGPALRHHPGHRRCPGRPQRNGFAYNPCTAAGPRPCGRDTGCDQATPWARRRALVGLPDRSEPVYMAGPDLRPANAGDITSVAYGMLPFALFEQIRRKFIAVIRTRCARLVPRTE